MLDRKREGELFLVIYGARGLTGRAQARELLAMAAEEHWGLSPLPETARAPGGKPYFPGKPELQFNLSHSGALALCALDSRPVGVDIQVVKEWRPSLPRRVCTREELLWLERQPEFWPGFTRLWALKEARAKAAGRGLAGPVRDIRVPLPREGAVRLDGLWFGGYQGPGWAAAVCGLCPPPEEILWREL